MIPATHLRSRCLGVLVGLVAVLAPLPTGSVALGAEAGSFPRPDLSAAEPSVRSEIEAVWQRLDSQGANSVADDSEVEDQGRADTLGELGRLYHAYRLERAAVETYSMAEALDGQNPVWPYLRATIHQRDRELSEAESALRRALEADPDLPSARLRLAEVLRLAGQDAPAEALYSELLDSAAAGRRTGVEAAALFGLGRLLASRAELDLAVERFEAALELAPDANAIHQQLGLAHRRLGDLDSARQHLSSAGPVEPAFVDPWVADLLPSGATARLLMGNRALRRGQLDRALAHHRAAYEVDSENPAVLRALALTLEKHAAVAGASRSSELLAEASELYGRGRRLAPDDPLLHFDFARAVLAAEGPAADRSTSEARRAALEALRLAIELAPTHTEAHLLLAAQALEAGELEEATLGFERVLELSPGHGEATGGLALVLLGRAVAEAEAGRVDSALELVERTIRLDADRSEAHVLAADLALRSGAEARAAEALDLARGLMAPGSEPWVDAVLELVRLRALASDPEVRDPARAVELAKQVFDAKRSPATAEVMALALASAGGFEQAIAWQSRLLGQARAAGAPADYLRRLEENLARYRSGSPANRSW